MDPVTAVGFAAGILTFIDFSYNLISGTYSVYKSVNGTTLENACINTVISDLLEVTEGLQPNVEGKAKHERALCKLAENCHDLAQDLLEILEKLKINDKNTNTKWKSLKVKWVSMRKEKEVASIEKRLDGYRSQILVRLNLMLR
jgi:hypothetical protein